MQLSPEQRQAVADWVRGGSTLADVQKRLADDFGVNLTYMDVRFLVDDLNLELQDPKKIHPQTDLSKPPPDATPATKPGKVAVSLDKVTRPGALVSGTVTFSDGVKAQWYFDQMGRLGLNPTGKPGYQPSEADLLAFQRQLETAVQARGF